MHLVAQLLFNLSGELVELADPDEELKLPTGRSDELGRIRGTDDHYGP